MIQPIFMIINFAIYPLILHELGHYIMLKYYRVPFKFRFKWKYMMVGFESIFKETDSKKFVRVSLMGGFTPLAILIYPILTNDIELFQLSSVICMIYAVWTCIETFINIGDFKNA